MAEARDNRAHLHIGTGIFDAWSRVRDACRGHWLTLGLTIGLLGLLLSLTPVGIGLEEDAALSWLFHIRGPIAAPSDVVVIAIDKRSAAELNLPNDPSKWPRDTHARLTENLTKAGARVIAYDLFFDKSRPTEHDDELARAIGGAGNVALVAKLDREIEPGKAIIDGLAMPIPVIADSALAVAPFPLPKVPARVNGYWTFVESAGQDNPTLPVVAFQIYALPAYEKLVALLTKIDPSQAAKLPASANDVVTSRQVRALVLSLREILFNEPEIGKRMLTELRDPGNVLDAAERHVLISLIKLYLGDETQYLNFYGPPRSIKTVPYYQILRMSDFAGPSHLAHKAVFVGFSEFAQPKQKDNYHTVFSDELSGLDLSGVEIAATAFANLLEDRPLRRLEAPAHLGIVFLFGLAAGAVCLYFSITIAAICTIALMLLYLGAAVHLFTAGGIWLPLVVPLCLQAPVAFMYAALCKYRDANRERQNIRRAFEYYLPSSVVDQLAKKLGPVTSENQLVYGTCLATDVERYTAVAEKMDPVQLTRLMNDYYQRVFRPVQQFGGIVSDIEGDAVLAIWAAANPSAELKHRACQASLGIACAVVEFNQTSGRPALRTRIGLDSGSMSIGSVGGGSHYEYRAVGDIVNTAHRIQGLNKRLGTQILASEATLDGVEGFLRRWLGSFLLEGKSRALRVFELLCPNQKANSDQRWLCSAFSDALNRYRAQQWQEASKQFLEILRLFPEDGPTRYYLKLSEQYKIHPPSLAAWNEGVVLIEGK